MEKFYNLSIFATLFFTCATSFEISPSLSKIPTLPENALGNPQSPQSIPQVEIVYPLSKPKVSPKPSPNKPLPSHLAPKSSPITTRQSQPSWGRLAPKSSIKQNLSPKPIEKHTSNSILATHSHVFSSKPIPHSTTKVTKKSPISTKYLPTYLTPKIPKSKQNLSPRSLPKPTRNHVSKHFLVRPKVGSHVSPKIASTTYKQKVNPKLTPKSTRKFSPNTHLAPKFSVTKPNILRNPTGKIITKTRLAPKAAPKFTHKRTLKHVAH
ncbi:hypothetical protein R3W88_014079 [Solanum pinnatisectum]|uniref:Uncharacterized protein n=1 Tax=Solanum pinnatisectum TaxID=50273 RepID=A0AAV9KR92_9SOLN|nr:hypothetical protein R3W88_014079 [Solanum pinnatisectum]